MDFLAGYATLADAVLISCGLALSQYCVLRAGVFSLATTGFAAIGAYGAALLAVKQGWPPALAITVALGLGALSGFLLSLPLARLRGVFQAIASFSFVQIVQSILFYSEAITGGSNGLNGIPKVVGTGWLVLWIAGVTTLLWAIGRSDIGRALGAARQDETVAVSLGIDVANLHRWTFVLSGAIAGTTGALMAFHDYSVMPETFGFVLLTDVLAYVILGGSLTVTGPLVGATILTLLPEIARPLADNRMILMGMILVFVMLYLPHGVADSLRLFWRQRRRARTPQPLVAEVQANG